jgi:nucleoside-triphosphatase THEP1
MAHQARITIISGPRDSGKTHTAARLAEAWKRQRIAVGGVVSEAVLSGGKKVRYEFRDLLTDACASYAVLRPDPVPAGVPAYEFLADGLRFGCAAVLQGMDKPTSVLVIDEIGPLEMTGGGLWEPARKAASEFPGRVVLTVRPTLLEELLSRLRLESRDVEVVTTR